MPVLRGAAAAAFAALCVAAPTAFAHEGNPNYRSEVREVAPAVPGLDVHVLNHDDRIELVYGGDGTLVWRATATSRTCAIDEGATVLARIERRAATGPACHCAASRRGGTGSA